MLTPDEKPLYERLRDHVNDRGGLSKDAESGHVVLPNGAWAMMLEAADQLELVSKTLKVELDSRLCQAPTRLDELTTGELLCVFRDFAINNATQWVMGSNHHHPIWAAVAESLKECGVVDQSALARDFYKYCGRADLTNPRD